MRFYIFLIFFFLFQFPRVAFSQTQVQETPITITGKVYQSDSLNLVPFAYVLNKNSSTGVVANMEAVYSVTGKTGDTIIFSYLGYHTQYIVLKPYKDSVKNNKLTLNVYLSQKQYELPTVQFIQNDFTENEKQYYSRIYNRPRATIESPISLLYERYSKRGKSLQKLDSLYEALLKEEYIKSRLNDAVLQRLTGNPRITVIEYRRKCYIPDYFVLNAKDYDLYSTINKCYKAHFERFDTGN